MKRSVCAWSALLLCLGSLCLLTACEVQTHAIRFEVDGTAAQIGVTYRNATGALEQRDIQGPWSMELQAKTGTLLTLRAVNKTNTGTVYCRILIDGQVFKEGESSGAFKVVDCSGLVPLPTPTPR